MNYRFSRFQIILGALVVVVAVGIITSFYTDFLWFQSLQLHGVFWRMVKARWAAAFVFGIPALLLVGVNLWLAERYTRQALSAGTYFRDPDSAGPAVPPSRVGYLVVGAVVVLLLGNIGSSQWPLLLRYLNDQPFNLTDPIFSRDVGFYVFLLPFYKFLANYLLGALILSGVLVGLVYLAGGLIRVQERIQMIPRALAHVSVLFGLFLLDVAWIYRLKIYGLLYTEGDVVFGASYADVNVEIWVYWLLVLVFLGAAGLQFANTRALGKRFPMIGLACLAAGIAILGWLPAAVVQKLVVQPSELARETPYLAHNISATRYAFGLDGIEEVPFEASEDLSRADVQANPLTIRNVPIWDERPLVQTYQQVQEIRPYYVFAGVDVDRYRVDGVYRQVMLSAREMDTGRLPDQARNWVNERLQYTHGYGVALSPVDHVTPEGLPALMVKDIPPVFPPGLEIERPELYYGEGDMGYVLVKTGMQEFDYPKGDGNKFSTYEGKGGAELGGILARAAFAVRFRDINLLLSNYIESESRIMLRRQIHDRAEAIAPYLQYDSDPYLVISNGRLYWILDAYSTTDMYPYATRGGRAYINYIRNSVKVVMDAYDGTLTYYRMDYDDPIIAAYDEMFPGLFVSVETMPADLRNHLRYPKDMFKLQATLYRSYHMQDVQLFYNQEDLWEIPNEIYSDRAQMIQPYYIIVKLPGEESEEFLLMAPFTPARKDNMIGWMAARCDGENYGDLLVYRLPKDRLIFGPMQLEARIDQQPEISSQLTLWGQKGSEVIRGNLLVIPIERSFMYVEPVYLQARQEVEPPAYQGGPGGPSDPTEQWRQPPRREIRSAAIPELKQVIVAFSGRVIMRDTFREALADLFEMDESSIASQQPIAGLEVSAATPGVTVRSAAAMASEAESQYRRVQSALKDWDWAGAGEGMQALERTLAELRSALNDSISEKRKTKP